MNSIYNIFTKEFSSGILQFTNNGFVEGTASLKIFEGAHVLVLSEGGVMVEDKVPPKVYPLLDIEGNFMSLLGTQTLEDIAVKEFTDNAIENGEGVILAYDTENSCFLFVGTDSSVYVVPYFKSLVTTDVIKEGEYIFDDETIDLSDEDYTSIEGYTLSGQNITMNKEDLTWSGKVEKALTNSGKYKTVFERITELFSEAVTQFKDRGFKPDTSAIKIFDGAKVLRIAKDGVVEVFNEQHKIYPMLASDDTFTDSLTPRLRGVLSVLIFIETLMRDSDSEEVFVGYDIERDNFVVVSQDVSAGVVPYYKSLVDKDSVKAGDLIFDVGEFDLSNKGCTILEGYTKDGYPITLSRYEVEVRNQVV